MWYDAVNFRLIGICSNGHVYLTADSPKVKDKAGDLLAVFRLDLLTASQLILCIILQESCQTLSRITSVTLRTFQSTSTIL